VLFLCSSQIILTFFLKPLLFGAQKCILLVTTLTKYQNVLTLAHFYTNQVNLGFFYAKNCKIFLLVNGRFMANYCIEQILRVFIMYFGAEL
jgi:hypothetical protein